MKNMKIFAGFSFFSYPRKSLTQLLDPGWFGWLFDSLHEGAPAIGDHKSSHHHRRPPPSTKTNMLPHHRARETTKKHREEENFNFLPMLQKRKLIIFLWIFEYLHNKFSFCRCPKTDEFNEKKAQRQREELLSRMSCAWKIITNACFLMRNVKNSLWYWNRDMCVVLVLYRTVQKEAFSFQRYNIQFHIAISICSQQTLFTRQHQRVFKWALRAY